MCLIKCPKCNSDKTRRIRDNDYECLMSDCRFRFGLIDDVNPIYAKQEFTSGATSSGNLPGYDMLPLVFLTRTAKRFTLGEQKHGKFNYRKGLKDKKFIIDRLNHAFLHLKLAIDLIENDTAFLDDNLSAVAVNIAMAMEYEVINGLCELNVHTSESHNQQ